MSAARVHADVLSSFAVALGLCLADAAGIVGRPPGFPVGAGLLLLVAVGVALGTCLGASVLLVREGLRGVLERRGSPGLRDALTGVADAAVLYTLVVYAQDPRDLQGAARGLVLVGALLVGAVAGRLLSERPRLLRLAAVAAVLGAMAVSLQLRWVGEHWTRLAVHAVVLVAVACLLGPLASRLATRRTTIVVLVCSLLVVAAADPLLRSSSSARHALWGRSSHVWSWGILLATALDGDGDGAVAWLGGRDCDPRRRDVHPGALEVHGNGRDDDCSGGDAGGSGPPPRAAAPARPPAPPDLLFVSVDSFRWDTANELGRVAAVLGPHAVLTRAVSPAAKTSNSLAAFIRGRPARAVRLEPLDGVRGLAVWRDPRPTVGHVLSSRGYRAVTVPTDSYLDPRYGVTSGLESVYAANRDARGLALSWHPFERRRLTAAPALAVLLRVARETPGPFFGWIHLMDSHSPFYREGGASGPADATGLRRSLRAEDALLARFLTDLAQARGRRPIVAIFGDHGEELGEHGGSAHGSSVHAEQVRVGLLLAGDGVPAGRFDAPVSIASLPATFLELAGAPVPASMTEPSLVGALRGQVPWPTVAVSESWVSTRSWVGYTFARYRLLLEPVHDLVELYDADRDPYERADLAARRPDLVRTLRRQARRWDEGLGGSDRVRPP